MSASRYPLPEQRFKVPMSQQALESWVSRFPDYGAPKDAPALRHADAVRALWRGRLTPMLSPAGTVGRLGGAARTCPPRAATAMTEMPAGAESLPYRNSDAIENILCLDGTLTVRLGPNLDEVIQLGRFDMLSVPVDVKHVVRNSGGELARFVVALNGPTGTAFPVVVHGGMPAEVSAEAVAELALSFDTQPGALVDGAELRSRVTRGEQLVAYKDELNESTGIPPAATQMLSAGSVYPLIVPVGHTGRARSSPMYGLPSLYLSIAECTPGEAGPPPHSHSDTQESFLCIEGEWEMTTGFDHEFVTAVKPYDLVPVPTKVMRGFRNTGPERSRLFVIIQGAEKMMDMVAFPKRVGAEMERRFGPKVVDEFAKIHLIFDAEDRVEAA